MPSEQQAELHRLADLHSLGILDSEQDPEFDQVVELAAAICGTPISLCSLVDKDRQWFKAAKGVSVRETPRELSFCSHAIKENDLMIVADATKDARFVEHPWVTGEVGLRFYAGMPLPSPGGEMLGTLCVADTVPRELTEYQKSALRVLMSQLKARIELGAEKRRLQQTLREKDLLVQALEIGNDRFLRFMNSGPFLSYIRDEDGRFIFYNRRVEERFSITSATWLGKTLTDLFPPEVAAGYRASDAMALQSDEPVEIVQQSKAACGRITFWRSLKFRYFNEKRRPMLGGFAVDITNEVRMNQELERTSAELKTYASTDGLTGLTNRRTFDDELKLAVRDAIEQKRPLSVILLDVDNFKHRNDTYGHQAGDQVLQRLGAILSAVVRATDIAARYGGEELILILPGTTQAQAVITAERIRSAILAEDWPCAPVTASFGVAALCRSRPDPLKLVARADHAMYEAKRAGKNRVAVA